MPMLSSCLMRDAKTSPSARSCVFACRVTVLLLSVILLQQELHAQTTPHFLVTPHLWLVPNRTIAASVSYETRAQWQAPLSGLEGQLQSWALLRCDFGVADNVTLQVRGAVQQQLAIDAAASHPRNGFPSSGTTRDAGDFSVATVMRFFSDKAKRTALGFCAETKLPNSTQSKGLGPNTTDIYLTLLASHRRTRMLWFGDLGIGILTAPRNLDEQNDVLRYGAGANFTLHTRLQFAFEMRGYLTTRNLIPVGTEARGVARAGASYAWRALNIEMAIVRGLTSNEGQWGFSAGLAKAFRL